MRAAIFLLLFPVLAGAQPATLDGKAINALTGEPLPGVHVRLVTGIFDGGVTDAYGAMSGRDGHFSVAGLKPGFYMLLPERNGFVYAEKSSGAPIPSVTFKPGEHVSDFQLKMTPRAVLQGRVLDDNGDPVQGAQVEPVPVDKNTPLAFRMNMSPITHTDDRGEFRISGGPGKFYLKASPSGGPGFGMPEIRVDGSPEAVYGVTYYPSAATAERGAPVEAVAGRDVTGIEIRLVRQRSSAITGVVTGIPQGQGPAIVMLRWGESADRMFGSTGNPVGPDGKFAFETAPDATFYQVSASYSVGNVRLRSPSVDVHPESDVRLQLAPGSEVMGSIEIAGDPPGKPAEKRTVRLEEVTPFFQGPAAAPVQEDGSFRIADLFAGKYRLVVQPMPENGYIQSVMLDGAPQGKFVDLTHGGSRLKVVLSRNAGQISGTVLDADGRPLLTGFGMVLLMQDPEHPEEGHNERMDSAGRYSFKGVAPGKYRLLAIDPLRSKAANGREDFKKLFEHADEIEIHEGEHLKKDVRAAVKEDADAKAK